MSEFSCGCITAFCGAALLLSMLGNKSFARRHTKAIFIFNASLHWERLHGFVQLLTYLAIPMATFATTSSWAIFITIFEHYGVVVENFSLRNHCYFR